MSFLAAENQVGRSSAMQQVGDMRLICGNVLNNGGGNGSSSGSSGGGNSTPTTGPKRGIMKKSPTNESNVIFNHNSNDDLLLPTIQLDSIKNYELNSYYQQQQQQQQHNQQSQQIQYSTPLKLPKSQTTPNMANKRKETHVLRSDL